MRIINGPLELLDLAGMTIGPSEAITVTQAMIDDFARATGDHQWIHVDVERAAREMPGGRTIAHGYLTLSLLVRLQSMLYEVRNVSRALNYGADRLRFIAPVPVGSRLRLTQTFSAAEKIDHDGVKLFTNSVFEVEGAARPVLVVDTIGLLFA